jgi:UDP-glucose 4-epimerase
MDIIIIGYSGFIGKNVFNFLVSNETYSLTGISSKEIDLTKDNSFIPLSKYLSSDCIVIMCSGIKKQLGDNYKSYEGNTSIINNFCQAISLVPPKKIIFLSSASVYGEDVTYLEKITEQTPVQPKSYYGISKYAAENLLKKTCEDNNISMVILRPPLIYGKDDLSRGYGPTGFIYKALEDKELILWGDGSEYREFIYIEDVSNIIDRILQNDFIGILNLVSGSSYTYKDIKLIIEKKLNKKVIIKSQKRSKEKVNHFYENELIKNISCSYQFHSLEDGINKMIKLIVS